MRIREESEADRAARLARLEEELPEDIGDVRATRRLRRQDGAVDPAHRLLVMSGGERGK
jgi:hypothetical protein